MIKLIDGFTIFFSPPQTINDRYNAQSFIFNQQSEQSHIRLVCWSEQLLNWKLRSLQERSYGNELESLTDELLFRVLEKKGKMIDSRWENDRILVENFQIINLNLSSIW